MSKDTKASGGEFAALLAEIEGQGANVETLAKAVADDDAARIEAAAAEGAGDGEKGDTDADGKKNVDGEEPVMKSLTVVGADGEEHEGIDATELLKSLLAKTDTIESNSNAGLKAVLGVMVKQGDLIKSLTEKVGALSAQGSGRRSVLTIAEKPGSTAEVLSKALGDEEKKDEVGMPKEEFFAKALDAAAAGLVSYHAVNHCETLVNKGGSPLPEVLAAVQKISAKAA